MLKLLKNLFLTKEAQAALDKRAKAKPLTAREAALEQARAVSRDVMTPERAELLRNALQVHKAKQKILADLSDEQRQRLVAEAMRRLLNEGRDGK